MGGGLGWRTLCIGTEDFSVWSYGKGWIFADKESIIANVRITVAMVQAH